MRRYGCTIYAVLTEYSRDYLGLARLLLVLDNFEVVFGDQLVVAFGWQV